MVLILWQTDFHGAILMGERVEKLKKVKWSGERRKEEDTKQKKTKTKT